MVSFLQRMDKRGDLDDTTITVYSDHGLYLNFFYYVMQETSMYTELRLLTLFTVLPREVVDKYGEILKENEQQFVGSYDLHNYFVLLTGSEKFCPEGQNLLEELPKHRTCEDIHTDVCVSPSDSQ